jgi:hypothetical protein
MYGKNKSVSIVSHGLRVEFGGGKGPSHLVVPLLLFPGTHKQIRVRILAPEGIAFENSVMLGDAFRATFSRSYSTSFGGSFFATASYSQVSGLSENIYEVLFLPDFRSILFKLDHYKVDTEPIGIQLAFPITNYKPDTTIDYLAEVKLEISDKVIETYRIPRAVHPKAGRILLMCGHSKDFYEKLSLSPPKIPINGLRLPFIEISELQFLSFDHIPAILSKGFQGIHLLTQVDSRGIIINDIYKSPSEFFKKVSGLGLKFIYFDTCNSVQVVSAFRHTDISALIAAIQNLEVNYANRFELNFYQALGNGKTISEAFQQAAFSQHRDRLSQGADFFTRSGCYDPMFLDLKEDFRFGEEY